MGCPTAPTPTPTPARSREGCPSRRSCASGATRWSTSRAPRTPTIINLWAQWCEPCRAESPHLRSALADLEGVSFIGINYDDPQPDWAIEFASLVGWEYPHVMDMDKELQIPLKVPGLPTTYFIDADGRIAGVHAGQLSSEQQLLDLASDYLGCDAGSHVHQVDRRAQGWATRPAARLRPDATR
ncbi:TlpA family protein disulfide reductase [Tessaracoccus sp. HDW20]|uniref:TlpA family protein disulfide reductase n=1 Tax=Tessaracoccus coleopterorum TaxID=2714950 RepID=UPI0018D2EB39|nr:TlpA disulfide reductase family protein [Tessaracoccus coleopterorum]NHB85419.1 TlpA family protein disulfide reductase [Tessaracoccus coleopterorum]